MVITRVLAMRFGPDITDPAYVQPIMEFNNSNKYRKEGCLPPHVWHTGWRAHLIVWLVKKLLPYPEGLYE